MGSSPIFSSYIIQNLSVSEQTRSLFHDIVIMYHNSLKLFVFFGVFFWIQLNVPFKIISLIETSQSIGWQNGSTPGKPPDTPARRTCLVSHVASAGLESTPDTAVR